MASNNIGNSVILMYIPASSQWNDDDDDDDLECLQIVAPPAKVETSLCCCTDLPDGVAVFLLRIMCVVVVAVFISI